MAKFDPTTPRESWHPIPSLPGYELSTAFRVRRHVSIVGRRPLKAGPIDVQIYIRPKTGYRYFNLGHGLCYLHRAVWEVANGRHCPNGKMVRHLDDDHDNNDPKNLALGVHADNVADAMRNGRYRRDVTA